jgi:hypothetical protein
MEAGFQKQEPRVALKDSRSVPYRLYGVALHSTLALPCGRNSDKNAPNVYLTSGNRTRFSQLRKRLAVDSKANTWFLYHRVPGGESYLRWVDHFEFTISADGRNIQYNPLNGVTTEALSAYLLGHVLSFSLLAFGFEPLHATVFVIDGKAVALVGDCGYGKSTLAAALVARGFPILTDDLMVLTRHGSGWMVQPGLPRLKLFPSVAERLLGHHAAGTPMNTRTAKLMIPLAKHQVVSRPVPLKALYILPEPGRPAGRVGIQPLSGCDAFLEVVRAAFNLTVTDKSRLANQFAFAERLVASVPVGRLSYRRSFAALPAVCDAILADVKASTSSPLRMAAAKRKASHGSSATI